MITFGSIEEIRQIVTGIGEAKIIAVSMQSDPRFALSMLEAIASGYLLMDDSFDELASAIRCVPQNKANLSSGIS